MGRKETLKHAFFHSTNYTKSGNPRAKEKPSTDRLKEESQGEDTDTRRVIRAVIAGGISMVGTLVATGATGMVQDPVLGCVAAGISFAFGFFMRLGVEYGVTVKPPEE